METEFGVLEVLKIAERLEHNGSQFYTKMAKLFIETLLALLYSGEKENQLREYELIGPTFILLKIE